MEQTLTLRTYEYKKNMPIYKASVVDLTLISIKSLKSINVTTSFGAEFYKLIGERVNEFLNAICELYERCSISDPQSTDYRTSYNFWFSERPLKRRIKYAELHLDSAMHKLNVLLNVLIIQLRAKYEYLKKIHVSSKYSNYLIEEVEKLLSMLPAQLEKEIVIHDKKDESQPTKTITITYEPFIEHVNASFSEASKLKRLQSEDKPIPVQVVKPVRHQVPRKERRDKKEVNVVDSDGFITKKK